MDILYVYRDMKRKGPNIGNPASRALEPRHRTTTRKQTAGKNPIYIQILLEEALQLQTGDNMLETDGKPVA